MVGSGYAGEMTEVAPTAPIPEWMEDVFLPAAAAARVLGQSRSVLEGRRRRSASSRKPDVAVGQAEPDGGESSSVPFPEPVQRVHSSQPLYRLSDLVRYGRAVGFRFSTPLLRDYLFDVAQHRTDDAHTPEALRLSLALLSADTAGIRHHGDLAEPDLGDLAGLVADAVEETSAIDVVDAILASDNRTTVGGASFTKPEVRDVVAGVATGIAEPNTVYDPCCGEASLLGALLQRGATRLTGREIDPAIREVARVRLELLAAAERASGSKRAVAIDIGDADPLVTRDVDAAPLVVADVPTGDDPWTWLDAIRAAQARTEGDGWAVVAVSESVLDDPKTFRRTDSASSGRLRCIVRLPAGYRLHHRSKTPTVVVLGPRREGAEIQVVDLVDLDRQTPASTIAAGIVDLVKTGAMPTQWKNVPAAAGEASWLFGTGDVWSALRPANPSLVPVYDALKSAESVLAAHLSGRRPVTQADIDAQLDAVAAAILAFRSGDGSIEA